MASRRKRRPSTNRAPGLRLLRSVYRRRRGWLIRGPGGGIFGTAIFTHSKRSAQRIRSKLRRDYF